MNSINHQCWWRRSTIILWWILLPHSAMYCQQNGLKVDLLIWWLHLHLSASHVITQYKDISTCIQQLSLLRLNAAPQFEAKLYSDNCIYTCQPPTWSHMQYKGVSTCYSSRAFCLHMHVPGVSVYVCGMWLSHVLVQWGCRTSADMHIIYLFMCCHSCKYARAFHKLWQTHCTENSHR